VTEHFRDRREAGIALAAAVAHLRDADPVVLALPRGGVPVGFEVARALDAPLDVILVRKLGVPFQPELGMGAIGEGGVRVLDDESVRLARVTPTEIEAVEARERVELERRLRRYRDARPMIPLGGRTAIVVDDGIATGGTARAALRIARLHGARRVVVAVPVAPQEVFHALAELADEIVVVRTPSPFFAIGTWYEDFSQTSDDEVREHLAADPGTQAGRSPRPDRDGAV
jgi:predicted phosphoribosyltransferase